MPAQIPLEEAKAVYEKIKGLEGFLPPAASRYLMTESIQYLSPDALSSYGLGYLRTKAKVDGEFGLLPEEVSNEIIAKLTRKNVPFDRINYWEGELKHDVRGLVRAASEVLSSKASSLMYIPCTSYDLINAEFSMGLRDFTYEVLLPETVALVRNLMKKTDENKETIMIGRTHRQHAQATTAGHVFAEFLGGIIEPSFELIYSTNNLRAKNSGFVGNQAGRMLLSKARGINLDFDKYNNRFSDLLGLKLDNLTGQTVHQYYYSDYFSDLALLCGGVANFTENIRHYQQTEVGEMAEQTLPGQVGSSTGAHKKNPITCENVSGGQWRQTKALFMSTLEDLTTDFQRDLRDSSNKRYYVMGLGNIALYTIRKGAKVAGSLTVRPNKMAENIGITRGLICAEPLQIYLQNWLAYNSGSFVDAHEHVRKLSNKVIENRLDFQTVVEEDELVQKALKDAPEDVVEMIFNPAKYIGTTIPDIEKYLTECEVTISIIEETIKEHKKSVFI